MIRSVVVLVFAVVLASCVDKLLVAVPKPTMKSISIVPATNQGKRWAIMADEKFAFPDFDYALANIESVPGAFSAGIREVVKRMSEQIHAALK